MTIESFKVDELTDDNPAISRNINHVICPSDGRVGIVNTVKSVSIPMSYIYFTKSHVH